MPKSLAAEIQHLAQAFTTELLEAVRTASLADLGSELSKSAAPKRRTSKKSAATKKILAPKNGSTPATRAKPAQNKARILTELARRSAPVLSRDLRTAMKMTKGVF